MHWVIWSIRGVIFLLILTFALKNTVSVPLTFFFGLQWEMPLIVLMLLFMGVGVILGVLAMVGRLWRLKREISALRRNI